MVNLEELCKKAQHAKGAVAEVGVYKGDTAEIIATYFPKRTFYLFDTFAGMPSLGIKNVDEYGFNPNDYSDTSEELVMTRLENYAKVKPVPGVFPDSLKKVSRIDEKEFAFVFLDSDLYKTTIAALEFFWERMSPGGILAVHDYQFESTPGVTRAVDEFVDDSEELMRREENNGSLVWFVKR